MSARRASRVICLALLALQVAYSAVLLPAVPALLDRDPVLLEALQASIAAMVAGGAFARVGQASLVLALIAPLPTLLMADPLLWWAGRLWGPKVAKYLGGHGPRGGRRTTRAVGFLERYGSWSVIVARLLPVPSALIYAAAGWNGMRLRRFLVLDLAGTSLWVALIVGLGYGVGRPAVGIAHDITRYGLLVGLALGLVMVAVVILRRLAGPPTNVPANGAQTAPRSTATQTAVLAMSSAAPAAASPASTASNSRTTSPTAEPTRRRPTADRSARSSSSVCAPRR